MFHPSDGNVHVCLSQLSRASEGLGFLRKGSYFTEANTTLHTLGDPWLMFGFTELPEGPGRSQNGCRMGDFGPPSSSRLQAPQSSAFHAIPHLVRPSFPITPDDPPPRPTLPSRKTLSSPFLHPSAPFSFLPNMFHSASDRGAPFQMLSETCWEENTFQGCSLSLTIFSN